MRKLLLAACCFLLCAASSSFATPFPTIWNDVGICDPNNPTHCAAPDASGNLPVTGTFSATLSGFTPNGNFATLTSAGTSGSVALPTGVTVAFQNTGTTTVSCTLGVGSATALANEIQVPASSTVFVTVGSNTWGACIDQTGSTSNTVVLAGGSGLGTGFGGGGGSGGGGAVFGPTAVGSAAANPPVLIGGTANATATGNVQVAKVDSSGTQYIDCSASNNTLCGAIASAPTLGSASGGLSVKTLAALSNTAVAVKASAGQVYKAQCYNPDASAKAYLQIFNVAAASVTMGTTAPTEFFGVGAGQNAGFAFSLVGEQYSTAISAGAATTATGGTAPTTALDCTISYN